MGIIGIVAVAQNFAIGRDGKLPWLYSEDLKFFKKTTTGNAVVMGFRTWRAIGKPLPNRLNIVLSRSRNVDIQANVLVQRSVAEVMALSVYLNCDLFVIGGAQTYEKFASVIDRWIVTEIPEKVEGADVFLRRDFLEGFSVESTKTLEGGIKVKFYEKMS